jgi:putrescine aminotransferase
MNAAAYDADTAIELFQQHVNPSLAALMKFAGFGDVELEAQGCYIVSGSGRRYLDCLGGYGVFSLGHRHPKVVAAVKDQLDRLPLSTKTFFNAPMAQLAARLAEMAPGDLQYTFFSNSGAESVEAALKLARASTGRTQFVAAQGGYHGKTMGALSATGRESFRKPFEPLIPGFTHVAFNDFESLRAAVNQNTAAVILETVQGEGGIYPAETEYLHTARSLCDASGALLIIDEVQTGLGRTGAWFGCSHHDLKPDILTLAKALGGGVMPIGATMFTPTIAKRVFGENPLLHTSTFGGSPAACAAALAALEVLQEENLITASQLRGEQFLQGLREIAERHPHELKEARGQGLMIGVEFHEKEMAELTINGMVTRGVVAAYTLNNPRVIRIEPPLIITEEEVEHALTVFEEAVCAAAALLADL